MRFSKTELCEKFDARDYAHESEGNYRSAGPSLPECSDAAPVIRMAEVRPAAASASILCDDRASESDD